MTRYLVDTDVLIDFLRGNEQAKQFIRAHFDALLLSAITVAELYAGVRDGRERKTLDEFVGLLPVLPITGDIAVHGGLLKREYGKSHGTGLADAIIAATATAHNAVLCSLNRKHFPMAANLQVPYEKLR